MPKENNEDRDEAQAAISDTGKDIKKGMDRYVTRIRSAEEKGEAPPSRRLYEV